jgi:hypothetical protein
MNYYESAEGTMITKLRAMQELKKHGCLNLDNISDFFNECGVKDFYNAQTVLNFLGY